MLYPEKKNMSKKKNKVKKKTNHKAFGLPDHKHFVFVDL